MAGSGLDLTSLLVMGAGALLVSKAMAPEAGGVMPGNTTTTAGSAIAPQTFDLINQAAGGGLKPTDQVQTITTTTPAGQEVTFATVNYSPWNPQPGQTVFLNPLDQQRINGWYIPQLPKWVIDAFGSETKAMDWLKMYSSRTDVYGVPTERVYQFEMPIKDWDALRTWANSAQQPITAAEAAAAGLTLDTPVNLNGYWDAVLRTGGWLRGVEILKGNRSSFNGLGRLGAVRLYNTRVDPRWY